MRIGQSAKGGMVGSAMYLHVFLDFVRQTVEIVQ